MVEQKVAIDTAPKKKLLSPLQVEYYHQMAKQLIEDCPEETLSRWYEKEHRSIRWICAKIGVSESIAKRLLVSCGIEVLSGSQAKSRAATALWADEQTHLQRHEQLHNPISQARRSESLKAFYRDHPEAMAERIAHTHSMRTQQRLNSFQYMFDILGENPTQTLERLNHQDNLSLAEIASLLQQSENTLRTWFRRLSVKLRRQASTGTKNELAKDIINKSDRSQWSSLLDDRELTILTNRFPIEGQPKTLKALRTNFGLTAERIRQIEAKAIAKLELATPT